MIRSSRSVSVGSSPIHSRQREANAPSVCRMINIFGIRPRRVSDPKSAIGSCESIRAAGVLGPSRMNYSRICSPSADEGQHVDLGDNEPGQPGRVGV